MKDLTTPSRKKNDENDTLENSFEDSIKFAYYIKNESEIKEKILDTINTRIRSLKSQQFVLDRVSVLNDNKKIVDEWESIDNQKGINDWMITRNDFHCFELIKSKINIVKIQSNEKNDYGVPLFSTGFNICLDMRQQSQLDNPERTRFLGKNQWGSTPH